MYFKPSPMNNFLIHLGLDILEHITYYIVDPRDLDNLLEAYPYLFTNVLPYAVREIFIDPTNIEYIDLSVLDKYPRLTSARVDLRVENSIDLYKIVNMELLTEACIRVSSYTGPRLYQILNDLIVDQRLTEQCYRLERYSPNIDDIENVWIGKGKFCVANNWVYSYTIICSDWIEHILVDISIWLAEDHLILFSALPKLTKISYIDLGYYPCTSIMLYNMLTINPDIELIESLPCSYIYDVNPKYKWSEIDYLINNIFLESYPNITTLYLEFDLIDVLILKDIFPNLRNIGMRYSYDVSKVLIDSIMKNCYECVTTEFEVIYKSILYKWNKIKIYLYLNFPNIEDRQAANRNPNIKSIISKMLKRRFENKYYNLQIITMNCLKSPLMLTLDNWLFANRLKI